MAEQTKPDEPQVETSRIIHVETPEELDEMLGIEDFDDEYDECEDYDTFGDEEDDF